MCETWKCLTDNPDKVNECPDNPRQLLLAKAVNRLDRLTTTAEAKIGQTERVYNQAWIGCNDAWVECIRAIADAKSEADRQAARIKYLEVDAKCVAAEAAYFTAQSEYRRIRAKIFWDLFADPANRQKIWRPDFVSKREYHLTIDDSCVPEWDNLSE